MIFKQLPKFDKKSNESNYVFSKDSVNNNILNFVLQNSLGFIKKKN